MIVIIFSDNRFCAINVTTKTQTFLTSTLAMFIIIIIIIILISSEIKRIQRLFRFICLSLIIWLLQSVGHAVDDQWRDYFFFMTNKPIGCLINGFIKIITVRPISKFGKTKTIISRLIMIVRVNVVLNRTVAVDSDLRFDNLFSSHLQSQYELVL